MANAMATRRQSMEEKAANEFLRRKRHGPASATMAVILPFEGNAFIVVGNQTAVGDGDAMGVAGKIAKHLFGSGKGALGINHPIGSARGVQVSSESGPIGKRCQIAEEFEIASRVGGIEKFQKQATEQTRKHAYRQEEAGSAIDPRCSIWRKAAAGYDAMKVGMILQVLAPAMKHGDMTYARTHVFWIGGDDAQGLGGGLEQDAINLCLVLMGDGGNDRRQGEYHMEVWHRQQVCPTIFQPAASRSALTFRTVPVAAGIICNALLPAVAALLHMTAEGRRAAGFYGTHDAQLIAAQMPAVGLPEFITMVVENIGNLQRWPVAWRGLAAFRAQAGGTTSRFSCSSGLLVA